MWKIPKVFVYFFSPTVGVATVKVTQKQELSIMWAFRNQNSKEWGPFSRCSHGFKETKLNFILVFPLSYPKIVYESGTAKTVGGFETEDRKWEPREHEKIREREQFRKATTLSCFEPLGWLLTSEYFDLFLISIPKIWKLN